MIEVRPALLLRRLFCTLLVGLLSALPTSTGISAEPGTRMRSASQALAAAGSNARIASGKQFFGNGSYAGSESCKGCHEAEHRSWRGTWHSKMEQWPSGETVVGDFSDRMMRLRLSIRGSDGQETTITPSARAFREGNHFYFSLFDQDDPAKAQTWQVAKVLGGKWDQGYEVRLGMENFLPAPIRWSVFQQDWIVGGFNADDWFIADGTPDGRPRQPSELPLHRVAEAKCNGCHMTGYRYAKGENGVWKSRPHGQGEIGVACESCHGPGARHLEEAHAAKRAGTRLVAGKTAIVNPLTDLNAEQATQVCGQCHGRGTHKLATDLAFPTGFLPGDTDLLAGYRLWSYSGTSNKAELEYFWPNDWASRNRQQYQDFLKSDHYTKAGMSCLSCHAFHGSTVGPQLRSAPERLCVECHRAAGAASRPHAEMYAGSEMDDAGVSCVDCHMPRIGSRSRATSRAGHQWDASSHVFTVPTPQLERTLGVRSACTMCHVEDGKSIGKGVSAESASGGGRATLQDLAELMKRRADEVRTDVASTQALLARADLGKPGTPELVAEARAKLGFVTADNSKGAHNFHLTRRLLRESKALAARAAGL